MLWSFLMWLDSVTSFSYKFAFVLQVFQLSFLLQVVENNTSTEYVLTEKTITPMGYILRSGEVKNDVCQLYQVTQFGGIIHSYITTNPILLIEVSDVQDD